MVPYHGKEAVQIPSLHWLYGSAVLVHYSPPSHDFDW